MKKIIIISYFFPPCSLTAATRVGFWAKNLHKFGYYPIIITRKWEKLVESFADCHYETSDELLIEKNKNFEIHYLPYKTNLRDRLHTRNKHKYIKKTLTLFENLFQNINIKYCPFKNLLDQSENIIKNNNIECVLISGNPFVQFKFGHILSKKYKIPWIADYRDAWTTSTINQFSQNTLYPLINAYNKFFEKKWIKTASLITATSKPIGDSITQLTGKSSKPVYNGYDFSDFLKFRKIKPNKEYFQISHIGTLYEGQRIEVFLEGFKMFCSEELPKIKILFPGLEIKEEINKKVKMILSGYENYYEITARVKRSKALELQKKSHILLHVGWDKHKGIIASKIYEYIGANRKILIVPGDKSSIDFIARKSGKGNILNSPEEVFKFLKQEYKSWKNNNEHFNLEDKLENDFFSRNEQTRVLSNEISKVLKK